MSLNNLGAQCVCVSRYVSVCVRESDLGVHMDLEYMSCKHSMSNSVLFSLRQTQTYFSNSLLSVFNQVGTSISGHFKNKK